MQLHRVALLVLLMVLLGLMTVFQPIQSWRLGYRMTALTQVRDRLVEENQQLELSNARLGTPEALLQRASALDLGLAYPKRWSVLKVRRGQPVLLPARAVVAGPRQ
ncbi:MAG: hypothetical protein HZA54_20910 [Planctomycetes bacterium]|nr:hypothetical protein [Planctomycetota bacterium]